MDKQIVKRIIDWIKDYVTSAHADGVVIGMSGGKDSLVVAKLCTEAIGKQNVYGVIMPNGEMTDKNDAVISCRLLGIDYSILNISKTYNSLLQDVKPTLQKLGKTASTITTINTAPRIRMATLYALAGSMNYLVANTSNLSETMVGYTTKWGDNVGDFAPIANFTKSEVCQIGLLLGLPDDLVNKTPSDGLSGKSDEENLGFTYENLDNFIRFGIQKDDFDRISRMHAYSAHKRTGAKKFENDLPNFFERR